MPSKKTVNEPSSPMDNATPPTTPKSNTQGDANTLSPPPAPRHCNAGCLDLNPPVIMPPRRAAQFVILEDPPAWNGPPSVGGNLSDSNDPFMSVPLAGSAPIFVPTRSHQSSPGGPASSSSLDPGPSSSPSPERDSTGGGPAKDSESSGGSGSTSGGKSPDSTGPARDDHEPVIVSTPLAAGKGKQPVRPQTPTAERTRFLQVNNVHAADFEEGKPFGRIKGSPVFKQQVQKLGVFGVKHAGDGCQTVYMFVDTLDGAKTIHDKLQGSHCVEYITHEAFRVADVPIPDTIDRFSSKITFTVTLLHHCRHGRFSQAMVIEMAKSAAARFGGIAAFKLLDASAFVRSWKLSFDVDYDSVADANDAVHITNPAPGFSHPYGNTEYLALHALGFDPVDPNSPSGRASLGSPTSSPRHNGSESNSMFTFSPSGRTATCTTSNGKTVAVAGYTKPDKIFNPASQSPAVPSPGHAIYQPFDVVETSMVALNGAPHPGVAKPQDVVDWRVEGGYDVRTTLMVRNIPPEMTGADFVNMLQATVPGKFDFAYNRIDFQKSQSVGYAFVNFTTTDALLAFVRTWRGRLLPHNLYRQHLRPCAVSYANTQGYECLVAKFRNSSILDEAKPCRPVLFWTKDSAPSANMVGQERPFPPVDNASKKGRSVENARISGLYTPRNRPNNGGRGGRRGGYTRYDRGTMAQQHEDNNVGYTNYQHGAGPAAVFGSFAQPRTQPIDWHFANHAAQSYPGMYQPPYPMVLPSATPFQGTALRTHTNGDLGYRHPVMPAELAPVSNPAQGQTAAQELYQPLLYPVKGQVPEYYRHV